MIMVKVHSNEAVCACISLSLDQQNNIIIDCFVCNRSARCILQAGTQSPSSGDVDQCCLQVQVETAFGVGSTLQVKPCRGTASLFLMYSQRCGQRTMPPFKLEKEALNVTCQFYGTVFE